MKTEDFRLRNAECGFRNADLWNRCALSFIKDFSTQKLTTSRIP
ncbi:hypothetical protein D1AOALGA4SA_4583 [Olavius algarvensis Delta 1 endosymbiont]|nr:hypothetical protein D1AOALGA4SA_4583 [Olavius algarvensis Delta 1 endosymbiont]